MAKMTKAQKRALAMACTGERVARAGAWEHHVSLATGDVWHGVPWKAHDTCTRNGWLKDDLITPEGLAAFVRSRP